MNDRPPIIVGAGPAGCCAAATLAAAGLTPIVIDEAPVSGGQIYRRAPAGFTDRKSTRLNSSHRV